MQKKILAVTVCNSISNLNNLETKCSWLMYYLGRKFKDEFISVVIKLGCPILSRRIDLIITAAMWQEYNISRKSQRIIFRHLSNFFG